MNAEKVFGFIDSVEKNRLSDSQDAAFHNSMTYKRHCLDKAKSDAVDQCINRTFEKFYYNAIPLNDDYKTANSDAICADIPAFVNKRGFGNLSYYVHEARKKGSRPAARILESVQNLVNEAYEEKELNLPELKAPDDLVFRMDDTMDKKIDVMSRDLELDDLASVISDNVKSTAASEILRAKKEKEASKELESELANDMNVTSEAAIDNALALRGYNQKKVYQPSLFEGLMIGNMNKAMVMKESGAIDSVYLYDALADYGFRTDEDRLFATPEEIAFVESVKDYTLLNISKALRLEDFNNKRLLYSMANEFAAETI